MRYEWNFPSNQWGQRQGISESGVETFKGRPIKSLAREICQNSLDAADGDKRVRVEFQDFYLNTSDFPGVNEYKEVLEKCKITWKSIKDKKTLDFIKQAEKTMNQEVIQFLRISDFNTTGLQGSDKLKDSHWSNLIKASGSSDKHASAGGSFGIGKFAPFACTSLRTVFYATKDIENLEAMQGISRLVSFQLSPDSEEETQGIGYYGIKEKNQRIPSYMSLQRDFERDEPGTDLFVAGFNKTDSWKQDIINEVLDGFLYAVYKGTLEVIVDDVIISKESLDTLFKSYNSEIDLKTVAFYETLISKETKWETKDFYNMGDIKIGILVGDTIKHNKKVAMIRKPWMKIKDQTNLVGVLDFTGILVIEGESLNQYLRKLENPQHTNWEPNRFDDKEESKRARLILKDLKQEIQLFIKDVYQNDAAEPIDVAGASDLIPLYDDGPQQKIGEDILSPRIKHFETRAKEKIASSSSIKTEFSKEEIKELIEGGIIEEGEDVYIAEHPGRGIKPKVPSEGDQARGLNDDINQEARASFVVKPHIIKLMCISRRKGRYRLIFEPTLKTRLGSIEVFKLDEQGAKEKITITEAKTENMELTVKNNTIQDVNFSPGNLTKVDFTTKEENYFSAEVKLYGTKE